MTGPRIQEYASLWPDIDVVGKINWTIVVMSDDPLTITDSEGRDGPTAVSKGSEVAIIDNLSVRYCTKLSIRFDGVLRTPDTNHFLLSKRLCLVIISHMRDLD